MGHKICLYGEIWLIVSKLSLLPLLIWSSEIVVFNESLVGEQTQSDEMVFGHST